ncbi:MAG: amino acid permease, partial [Chloroflexota bacterium]
MSDAVASPAVGAQTSGQIFSRESSGLVRIGSPWRMLLLNVANVGVVYIMFTYWSFPAIFPQSNLLVAIPIAAALALPFNLLYGMFASIMPRTGSEYVFLSRTFHPAIGFMASFAAAMSQAFWVGIGGYWIAQFVLGPLLSSYGLASGNQTIADIGAWANDPTTWFIFGTVFIVLMTLLNIRGLRAYLKFQDINWIVGAVTGVLLLLIFFMATTTGFQTGFDKYAAAAGIPGYQQTLTLAASGGMPTGFTLTDTLGIIPIIWLIAWASTYMGGEVRSPTKTQLRATVGGMLLYAGIAFVLFFA